MVLILNELSAHDQFTSSAAVEEAMRRLIGLRNLIQRYGRELHCSYSISQRPICGNQPLAKSIADRDLRSLLLGWLDKSGPYWSLVQVHSEEDWYAIGDEPITGSGLAEAACLKLSGQNASCVSIDPSNWLRTPIDVRCGWKEDTQGIDNHWAAPGLEAALKSARPLPRSWNDLPEGLVLSSLVISEDAFNPLRGQPFNLAQAEAIHRLILILDDLSRALCDRDEDARRAMMNLHFTGDSGKFSDSSDTEKRRFGNRMTFRDPHTSCDAACYWHGKVSSGTLRLHFTDPHTVGRPLSLCYVGPKITRQ